MWFEGRKLWIKKKLENYNAKLKEYNNELSKLYSKMESEIKLINKIGNVL